MLAELSLERPCGECGALEYLEVPQHPGCREQGRKVSQDSSQDPSTELVTHVVGGNLEFGILGS